MSTMSSHCNQQLPGLLSQVGAAVRWMGSLRGRRSARMIVRNARWVVEARRTPPVWTG
jgi:hypothetical protein